MLTDPSNLQVKNLAILHMSSAFEDAQNVPPLKKAKLVEAVGNGKEVSSGADMYRAQKAAGNPANNGGSKENAESGDKLDSNLYSRQIYALGESAMYKLRQARVLISGLGSVGVEISKNLILGGIRHISLHDTKNVEWKDLSAQYYLNESHLGKNRAESCFAALEELNDSVQCNLSTEELTEEIVAQFDLVVLTDQTFGYQKIVNNWCRVHNRYFISADARGLFSYSFVDLGNQFRIDDASGDPVKEILIEYVDRNTGNVMTLEENFHGFEDGDYVTFSEIKGMAELNNCEPRKITVVKPNVFNIGPISAQFADYIEGGRCRQVKVPSFVDFKTLEQQLAEPECVIYDYAHFDAPSQLHALWQALYIFEEKHGRAPEPRNDDDTAELKKLLPEGSGEVADSWITPFSYQARGNLQPVTSLIGGITAQEAMKAVTHHTTPQKQFLYTHHLEALPGDWSPFNNAKLTAEDCAPRNSRYDAQAAVFGWGFQEALQKQKWFIVGSGAIGCELLKNFAMIGLGCSKEGKIKITDMDQIELSNLNRQFLFRRKDMGGKKSEVAAKAVKSFNPDINIQALADRVAPDTEEIFNDDFFEELSGVANALDNIQARRYMDSRCVYYQKPLLESGTMGAKGNTQVVYPHITESYSSTNDPPEKDIPICTLKNFPYEIQHTIQWARGQFEDLFTNPAEKVNQYLTDTRGFLERLETMNPGQAIADLRILKQSLIDDKPKAPEDCVLWALKTFQTYYHNEIAQLLHNFPAEQLTDSGVKFWSGTKRCPHVLNFDPENTYHFDFVYSASILRAQQYKLIPILDKRTIAEIASTFKPAPFVPRSGVKIAVTEAEAKEQNGQAGGDDMDETDTVLDGLKLALARLQLTNNDQMEMIDFEKDDDTNHHVEFVTAASNLRAENYDIALADAMKTKQIAGRIIPALATTTSVVAGLVAIELYKCVDADGRTAKTPVEQFKNGFLNLASPFYTFSEPGAAPKKKYGNNEFTLWDRIEIKGPATLKEFIEEVENKTELTVSMISCGVSLLYAFFHPPAKVNERKAKNLVDVVQEVSRGPIPSYRRALVLDATTSNEEDEDVEIPYIKYII
ncbi:unnamed protein product [Bursaphelenchus okinawaensis]|uniref:E1 ubiquitin-activating enzyme n=1 Tax=Bursaphelenchus okinawaensis TaxID=465554 RepID=A0A811LAA3_9BILA|nr:unnamed protein product [Bursaphelenchus okinawaensis]CAG9120655.1 unnamed protein product [Bursaphelenchus okinawaensis]